MTATTATTILGRSRMSRRGFGLVDVSLGIIAGIALLVGAVILFQSIQGNNRVSEVTRNAVTISSEIRTAARNMDNFLGLPNTSGVIDLARFGFEPAILNNPVVSANVEAATPNQFNVVFNALPTRICGRLSVNPANLGSGVIDASCASDGTLFVTYGR